MIFESHAHYDDEAFDEDREVLLASMQENGIERVINVCAEVENWQRTIDLMEKYSFVYGAVGVHPDDVGSLNEEMMNRMHQICRMEKTVAVGEIGLDYYWDKESEIQKQQRYWFKRQLALAKEKELPVIIHSRDAAEDTMNIMKEAHAEGISGVIHCYSYSPEMAKEYVNMGYYIGVGGVVTFKNARKLVRTVEEIPLEHILLETDCPYMAPEPHRGSRNDSRNIPYVIAKIAEIKGISPETVEKTTRENAFRLFSRVPR